MSMITATAWVPRGFAAPFPTKYNFDEEEFQRIAELARLQLDDANDELDEAREEESKVKSDDAMKEDDGSDDEAPTKAAKSTGLVLIN
jgi:periodic tryptophan protein 1